MRVAKMKRDGEAGTLGCWSCALGAGAPSWGPPWGRPLSSCPSLKWELRWGGKCQGKEKATQQFAEPDAASLGHKMKWLWCNVKLHIDFFLLSSSFPLQLLLPDPEHEVRGFGLGLGLAGPRAEDRETAAWPGCPHPEGMLLERFGLSVPCCDALGRGDRVGLSAPTCPSAPHVRCPWGGLLSPSCCSGVHGPSGTDLGTRSLSSPLPSARGLPDDSRAKPSQLLRVSVLAPSAGTL